MYLHVITEQENLTKQKVSNLNFILYSPVNTAIYTDDSYPENAFFTYNIASFSIFIFENIHKYTFNREITNKPHLGWYSLYTIKHST